MTDAFSHDQDRFIPNEGAVARVTVLSDKVILEPTYPTLSGKENLRNKIQKQKEFDAITASVPGLYHPRILSENPILCRYEVEKAKGFNLTLEKPSVQGGNLTDFLNIPLSTKVKGVLTYLQAISTLNKAGYCFRDHKSDSVFIDPVTEKISIVDSDGIVKEPGSNKWQSELSGGLSKVMESFFTRGLSQTDSGDSIFLIPAEVSLAINGIDSFNQAEGVVTDLENWINGSKSILRIPGYDAKGQIEFYSDQLGSPETIERVKKFDFEHATEYQTDLMEAEIQTKLFQKSDDFRFITNKLYGRRDY